jgi:hypothetical protein
MLNINNIIYKICFMLDKIKILYYNVIVPKKKKKKKKKFIYNLCWEINFIFP